MTRCTKCKSKIGKKDKFCPKCGAKIEKEIKTVTKEGGFFYKINYSYVSLFAWLFMVIIVFILSNKPDSGIRMESFHPYEIILLIIVLDFPVIHLILRRKDIYPHKGKFLAILMFLLLILFILHIIVFTGKGFVWCVGGHYDYKYYSGCEKEEGYDCSHYAFMGLGKCDECRKLICPSLNSYFPTEE